MMIAITTLCVVCPRCLSLPLTLKCYNGGVCVNHDGQIDCQCDFFHTGIYCVQYADWTKVVGVLAAFIFSIILVAVIVRVCSKSRAGVTHLTVAYEPINTDSTDERLEDVVEQ